MFECKMISRKPSVYSLLDEVRECTLKNRPYEPRSRRWELEVNLQDCIGFPSKRAAVHFFKTGEKYKTKPVYLSRGKTQKRIR